MKVYAVHQVVPHEGWVLMKIFNSSKRAWHYKENREALGEPSDVSYVVEEWEVE